VQCDACPSTAIVDQPYRGAHLCGVHLMESVRDRVRHEMHQQFPRFRGGVVAVALSGGKDSAAALYLTHAYFRRRTNVRIVAITVDEGIQGYRPATIATAEQLAASLSVEHVVVRSKDRLGVTTDEVARARPRTVPCSYCGVWRRRLLNDAARSAGADVLVLGFNLDDMAQTVLMNLAHADLPRLARMAPHRRRQEGLVPRIAPLATVPEREVYLFAREVGLPFDHGECPHANAAARNVFREVVWRLEEEFPGTRHALLRTRSQFLELLERTETAGAPARCIDCGEPSAGERCRACEFLRSIRSEVDPGVLP
jgi:uncharacterized protein (TIGR00269 family)